MTATLDLKVASTHPLEPLSAYEVLSAVTVVRTEKQLPASFRFVMVNLLEPPREQVLQPRPGEAVPRQAFLVLLDNATGRGYEAVVDLGAGKVVSWVELPAGVTGHELTLEQVWG